VTTRRRRPLHQDSGAALILAMAFVVLIGAISAGLASLATSSVNNRGTLELVRDQKYAADGKIEEAISWVRLHDGLTCGTGVGSIVDDDNNKDNWMNGVAIRVDWRNACGVVPHLDTETYVLQRNVIFSACKKPSTVDAKCQEADVIVRARVNFQGSSGLVTNAYVQSWTVEK
jgi:hypothetical protein